jgi:hypothetical protein
MGADADEGVRLVWSARGLAYVLGKRGIGELPLLAASNGTARVELRVARGELREARWIGAGGEAAPRKPAPAEDGSRR